MVEKEKRREVNEFVGKLRDCVGWDHTKKTKKKPPPPPFFLPLGRRFVLATGRVGGGERREEILY